MVIYLEGRISVQLHYFHHHTAVYVMWGQGAGAMDDEDDAPLSPGHI